MTILFETKIILLILPLNSCILYPPKWRLGNADINCISCIDSGNNIFIVTLCGFCAIFKVYCATVQWYVFWTTGCSVIRSRHHFKFFAPGRCSCNLKLPNWFQTHIKDRYLEHLQWNCPQMSTTRPNWWLVNILVQVMAWCRQATSHYMTNVDSYLCRHMESLGHNRVHFVIGSTWQQRCRRWKRYFQEHFLEWK